MHLKWMRMFDRQTQKDLKLNSVRTIPYHCQAFCRAVRVQVYPVSNRACSRMTMRVAVTAEANRRIKRNQMKEHLRYFHQSVFRQFEMVLSLVFFNFHINRRKRRKTRRNTNISTSTSIRQMVRIKRRKRRKIRIFHDF